jgi:CRISPR-associated protein (TIGR03986 family)
MAIRAPYRFIPISRWIHEPAWAKEVSQDLPFADGVSGWLDLEIEAKTPVLVGGERTTDAQGQTTVEFFRLPDGKHGIPGSTQRGLIRSVLEIASFGRAAFIDKRRHGLRDLTPGSREIYGSRLTQDKVRAGWLHAVSGPDGGIQRKIQPCQWAKVRVEVLAVISMTKLADWEGIPATRGVSEAGHSVRDRYEVWDRGRQPRQQTLHVDKPATPPPRRAWPTTDVGRVSKTGTVVLTGKPSFGHATQPGKKKYEFFFYDAAPSGWLNVDALWDDFRLIHEPQPGAAGGTGNSAWPYWKPFHDAGQPVPVFYLEEAGRVTSFGLAMMFRLAHGATSHGLLEGINSMHTSDSVNDIPTLLFGRAAEAAEGEGAQEAGLKGRVAFEPAIALGSPQETRIGPTVLGSPKAQFYPAYVRQPVLNGKLVGGTYASYTPLPGAQQGLVQNPELAGRKRYPVKVAHHVAGPGPAGPQMRSILRCLAKGTRFVGRVRFHNLKPAELGALVWALRLWAPSWGAPRPDLRHSIGMGKSFGLGQVEIRIADACVEDNRPIGGGRHFRTEGEDKPGRVRIAEHFADDFADHMRGAFDKAKTPGAPTIWSTSVQVESLLAMADPSKATGVPLEHMLLAEFTEAKNDRGVLPDYPRRSASPGGEGPGDARDESVFPSHSAPGPGPGPARHGPASAHGPAPFRVGQRVIDDETGGEVVEIVALLGNGEAEIRFDDGETGIRDLARLRRMPP